MNQHEQLSHSEVLDECRNGLKSRVSWQTAGILMTLIIAVIGWLIASQIRQTEAVSKANERVGSVEGDIKAINVNIAAIKGSVDKIERGMYGK